MFTKSAAVERYANALLTGAAGGSVPQLSQLKEEFTQSHIAPAKREPLLTRAARTAYSYAPAVVGGIGGTIAGSLAGRAADRQMGIDQNSVGGMVLPAVIGGGLGMLGAEAGLHGGRALFGRKKQADYLEALRDG